MRRSSKTEPRSKQLNFSLTKSEFEDLKRRAEAIGMRPVHFGRALLFDGKRAPASVATESNNMSALIYAQLVRLGNNLNQLVRRLHQTGDPLPLDLEPLLKDIRQIIARGCSDDR